MTHPEFDGPMSELKIALDNRSFEIQLFWQRSNYFLVLMTALGIAAFSIRNECFSFVISIFATVSSYLWYRTNLSSKFWQESWELEVGFLANELNIRSFKKSTSEVVRQVREHINSENYQNRTVVRKWIDNQMLKKYSATYNMILLSLFATFLWAAISIALLIQIMDIYCTFQQGKLCCASQ